MISGLLKKIFGSRNDRLIKQYFTTVKRINALEPSLEALSDEQLRAKTVAMVDQVQPGFSAPSSVHSPVV